MEAHPEHNQEKVLLKASGRRLKGEDVSLIQGTLLILCSGKRQCCAAMTYSMYCVQSSYKG